MAVITTGLHPKDLWPGVKAHFGLSYNEQPLDYPMIFKKTSSDKAFEEYVEATGFGLGAVKPQGSPVSFVVDGQGYTARATNVTYALGYIITMEELADNLYEPKAMSRAKKLSFSMRQAKEYVGANIINRITNASYTGGDSVVLASASHPTRSGLQSNILDPAADISETAIEDMCTQVMGLTNNVGNIVAIMPEKLLVPRQLWFEANRILKSTLQNDTANNATNVLKATNALPGGIVMNHYLTDADAWGILTNCPDSLMYQERMALKFTQDNDFDTENAKAKAVERFTFLWADWRGIVWSTGS